MYNNYYFFGRLIPQLNKMLEVLFQEVLIFQTQAQLTKKLKRKLCSELGNGSAVGEYLSGTRLLRLTDNTLYAVGNRYYTQQHIK